MARSSTSVCATRHEKLRSDNAARNKSRFIIIVELENLAKIHNAGHYTRDDSEGLIIPMKSLDELS
jgi:hypothetical protein